MTSEWRGLALCGALATLVMFAELGGPRLWDRDEPRNAGCAAEMLQRGDWVTPVFNGELRAHKPVMLYWLMMPGYRWLGVNEFTARLPSAALAVGTCLLTWFMGLRLFGARVGVLASIVLCSSLMFVIAGRAATPDSVLIFFTTAATAVYVGWAFPAPGQARDRWAYVSWPRCLVMYGLMGLAVLAKGPVGLVLPTAVIGMFLLLQRLSDDPKPAATRWGGAFRSLVRSFAPGHFLRTCWHMRPLTAIVVALAVALPWYLWVGVRTEGAWLQGFFLEHNLGRAMRPMESHGGGPLFYPLALLIGMFPWSVFASPAAISAWRTEPADRDRRAVLFCACWVCVYVGLFTIARTKLPSYVTPCYPALALLVAWQLERWRTAASQAAPRWMKSAVLTIGIVGLGMAIGLPIAAHLLLPGEEWLGIGAVVPIAAAAIGWRLMKQDRRGQLVGLFAASSVLTVVVAFGWMSQHVSKHQQFDSLLTTMREHSPSGVPRIATYRCMEPSWVFYAGHKVDRVWIPDARTPEEREAEQQRPAWSPNPPLQDLEQYLAQGDAFIITTDRQYRRHQAEMPEGLEVLARAPLFLKDAELLVLHRPESEPIRTAQRDRATK